MLGEKLSCVSSFHPIAESRKTAGLGQGRTYDVGLASFHVGKSCENHQCWDVVNILYIASAIRIGLYPDALEQMEEGCLKMATECGEETMVCGVEIG